MFDAGEVGQFKGEGCGAGLSGEGFDGADGAVDLPEGFAACAGAYKGEGGMGGVGREADVFLFLPGDVEEEVEAVLGAWPEAV